MKKKEKVDRTSPEWWGKYHQLLSAKRSTYREFANDPRLGELAKAEGLVSAFPGTNRIQRAANIISEAKARYQEDVNEMYAKWFSRAPVFLRNMQMVHIGACQLAAERNPGPSVKESVLRVKGSRRPDTGFAWIAETAISSKVQRALGCAYSTFRTYKGRLPSSLRAAAPMTGKKNVAERLSRSAVIILLKFRLEALKSRPTAKALAREIVAKQGVHSDPYYVAGLAELKEALRALLD